jgi:hypothetical protein
MDLLVERTNKKSESSSFAEKLRESLCRRACVHVYGRSVVVRLVAMY